MDLSNSIAPKSDQLDAEDLLTGPRVVTVASVRRGPSAEQPVNIYLEEFDRPWRPAKTVRRILVAAWGADASNYTGRHLRIYRDPEVRFGGMAVGGIRVSHLSHIEQRISLALTVTRGKRLAHVIEPFPEEHRRPDLPTRGRRSADESGGDGAAATADPNPGPSATESETAPPETAVSDSAPSVEDQQAEIRQLAEQKRQLERDDDVDDDPGRQARDEGDVIDTRPKKISPGQRAAIIREFNRLGVEELPMRLTFLATLTGRDGLDNPNDLTFQQAVDVHTTLADCTSRDDLEALANGQGSLT